jgi:putative ABC transport system permease protein
MDSLFGLSMTVIMIVLLGALAIGLGSVAYVALRNRIFFMMGLRNMPRRASQTVLIVIGLMLSTLIISAAFTTGDTVDYSVSSTVYRLLGHIDEEIQQDNPESAGDGESPTGLDIPMDQYEKFQAALEKEKNPDIDGSLGVLFEEVPVINPASRLSEPSVTFAGLDADSLEGFPDVISASTGELLDVGSLRADEAYMNQSAVRELDVRPGDRVQVFVQNEPNEFTILDIVADRVLTGTAFESRQAGIVTRLDTMHRIFGHDHLTFIAVSNRGGVRDTLALTENVEGNLKRIIKGNGLSLDLSDSKKDTVEFAELLGNFMATFFLILGLFSIGAGVLLIVMIFVMLAAERKPEMGMARAVGTKRGHLVQTFMSEGMGYNVLAAMVGAGLGILVAFGMTYVMGKIFSSDQFSLSIQPRVTLRTLVVSYSLGVVLTFITVTFSSWQISNLNIVSAIRGTADNRRPVDRRRTRWGWLLTSLPAMIVPPLGLWLLCRKGLGLPWSWRWVAASLPLMIPPLSPLGLWFLLRNGFGLPSAWIVGGGGIILGTLFAALGISGDVAFPFALGYSLIAAGVARTLTILKLPDRPVYTAAGVLLLLMWGLTAGGRLEFAFGPLEGDIEMFFLSGIAMVTASTFVLVYNADVLLAVLSRIGGAFGSVLPAMRTAVAYPAANRFRTGMTVAMISLVVFSLTMMSTMNLNFSKLYLTDDARGGWDIVVQENANNPIADLSQTLATAGSDAPAAFRTEGRISVAKDWESTTVRQDPRGNFEAFPISGVDEGFIRDGRIPLEHRATGFDSDEAVWQALLVHDDVAVIDSFAVTSGGFGDDEGYELKVAGVKDEEEVFDAIPLQIHDPVSGRSKDIDVIGVMSVGASSNFGGLYLPDGTFREVFGEPETSVHYVSLQDPARSSAVAKDIEATLLTAGVQAESLKDRAAAEGAFFRNFFYLMQAFMGLGLFVGIAAVGVIAFRTVVERRQQIGMLRAIGYKRSTVALSFMLESSFVTLLGIFSGIGLAVWLAYFLITSDDFPEGSSYHVPWLQIVFFGTFTYLASLLMTYIPARQAASIPTAEALRYE